MPFFFLVKITISIMRETPNTIKYSKQQGGKNYGKSFISNGKGN